MPSSTVSITTPNRCSSADRFAGSILLSCRTSSCAVQRSCRSASASEVPTSLPCGGGSLVRHPVLGELSEPHATQHGRIPNQPVRDVREHPRIDLDLVDEAAPEHRVRRDPVERGQPARSMRLEELAFAAAPRDRFVTRQATGGELALELDQLALRLAGVEQRVGVDAAWRVVVGARDDRVEELAGIRHLVISSAASA
jgi:hypothetical protein